MENCNTEKIKRNINELNDNKHIYSDNFSDTTYRNYVLTIAQNTK